MGYLYDDNNNLIFHSECSKRNASPAQILMHKRIREKGMRVFLIKGLTDARNTLLIVSG